MLQSVRHAGVPAPIQLLVALYLATTLSCSGGKSTSDALSGDAQSSDTMPTSDTAPGSDVAYPSVPLAIVIDFAQPKGAIRDLLGANRSPAFADKKNGGTPFNGATLLKAFGITQIRLHDADLDLCQVYTDDTLFDLTQSPPKELSGCARVGASTGPPHLSWSVKNPSTIGDVNNYDFSTTDELLKLVQQAGAKLYLRLGESFNGPNDTDDADNWAAVATKIYLHVLGRFKASGSGMMPLFVEIHNEPDGMFWVGTNTLFFELYRKTFDSLVTNTPNDLTRPPIGGAGFTHGITKTIGKADALGNGFIAAVEKSRLEFYSAHYYGECASEQPGSFASWLDTLRSEIDADGLQDVPLHITEWNIGLGQDCGNDYFKAQRVQSFVGTALILMQVPHWNVTAAHYYAGLPVMGLFAESGSNLAIRPGAWAFLFHRALLGGTRVETLTCVNSTCRDARETSKAQEPVVAMGVIQADGSYHALVVNDANGEKTLTLQLRGPNLAGKHIWVTTGPSATDPDLVLAVSVENGYRVPTTAALNKALGKVSQQDLGELVVTGSVAELSLTIPAESVVRLEIK